MSQVDVIGRNVEKTHIWLRELADELGYDNERDAYRVLRAYLHTLRDRLTVNEAAQLAAQLPELIRGIFYEGWVPAHVPQTYRQPEEFLRRVAEEGVLAGETEASFACDGMARLLARHISEGELEDVIAVLPEPLRPFVRATDGRKADDA